jgi:hypothetical protein
VRALLPSLGFPLKSLLNAPMSHTYCMNSRMLRASLPQPAGKSGTLYQDTHLSKRPLLMPTSANNAKNSIFLQPSSILHWHCAPNDSGEDLRRVRDTSIILKHHHPQSSIIIIKPHHIRIIIIIIINHHHHHDHHHQSSSASSSLVIIRGR